MTANISPKVQELLELLDEIDSVEADGPLMTGWIVEGPTGDPDNEVIKLLQDPEDDSSEVCLVLTEGAIEAGHWSGTGFVCADNEGVERLVRFYKHQPVVAPSAMPKSKPSASPEPGM